MKSQGDAPEGASRRQTEPKYKFREPSRIQRGVHLLITCLLPGFAVLVGGLVSGKRSSILESIQMSQRLNIDHCLRYTYNEATRRDEPSTEDDRKAKLISLAWTYSSVFSGEDYINSLEEDSRAWVRQAVQEYGNPSASELAWAAEHDRHFSTGYIALTINRGSSVFSFLVVFLLAWGGLGVLSSILFRGGILRLFGMTVVMPNGRPASRSRTLWRFSVAAIPLFALYAAGFYGGFWLFGPDPAAGAAGTLWGLGAAALVHGAVVAHAIMKPGRGWPDLGARTRLSAGSSL